MAEASRDGGDDGIRDGIRDPQQVIDPQILKEFIQKADDAKATEIKILYEGRNLNVPQKGEGDSPLKKFCKAPALCIYYDAYFAEEDWKEMQMFGDSVLNEPFKFGMGYMSAFHLTDYPMIISNDKVFFINPLEVNGVRVIQLKDIGSNELDMRAFKKSINGTFGLKEQNILEGRFEGTFLWFPLRKAQSTLSEHRIDNQIYVLLKAFMTESHQMLLFLKNILCIKLYVNLSKKDKDNTTLGPYNHGKREEFFTVKITKKEYLQSKAKALQKRSCETVKQEFTPFCCEVSIRVTELDKYDKEYNYIVMFFFMAERDASAYLAHLRDDIVLSNIPLVGIAAPLCQKSIEEIESLGGHIFCYQPLPQTPDNHIKGLPVHIHAPFELNRREMTLVSDMERNRTLIEEVLPEAYCEFIKYLVKRSSDGNNKATDVDLVYRSIPNETSETWQPLRNGLLRKLLQEDILFTEIGSGKWIKYTEAVVASEMDKANKHIQCVFMLLKSDKVNVVLLPDHVPERLGKIFSDSIQRLSPLFLCQHMKTNHSYNNLDHHQKDSLLVYIAEGGDQLLNGIKLLPLSDGTYTSFMDGTDEYSHVFVEPHSTVSLFPDLGSRFVSTEVSSTFDRMKTFAKTKKYQLMQLSWTSLVACLVKSVQCRFGSCTQITSAQLQGHIWSTQIEQLWKLIGRYFPIDGNSNETMDMFKDLPLFPVVETDGDAGRQYLNALKDIYLVYENPGVLTSNVLKAFDQLGVRVIDKIPSFVNEVIKKSKDILEFFHTCSGDRIDALLSRLSETNVEKFNTMASADANYEEHHLVEFLSSALEEEESLKSTDVIRRIRIWQQFKSPLNRDEALVSLEQNNAIWTDRTFPVFFDQPMIITEYSHFAKRLGAREMSVMEMCVSRLNHIATLNDKDLHLFIDWLLDREVFLNNEDIKKLARETEVVQKMLDHLEYIRRNYSSSGKINLEHVTKIYRWLNDNSDLKFVKSYLDQLYETNEVGCVWTGDGFNAAGTVIADQMPNTRNYAPFLNSIAIEHADLTSFFIAIGCIGSVTPDTYVKTLSRIKDASERANSNVTNEDMMSMSIDILNTLQREYSSEQLSGIGPIYVPIATEDDASFQMREANECTYHDAEWHDDEEAFVYAHRDVPLETAQSVGVWSVTQRLLTECEGFEARVQPKPLTQRIYELLNKNYVGEFTIVEKLFQNAEHAGASCMRILYDERGNENFRDNLLSPEMEEMQGPALWIHYDACFSDKDFENIINLNGQFGLDFCSVYNLTDVPSILSRSKLVIFDPNMRFLQQAFPGKTGVIIDFERERNQKLIAKCKNQFQPFQNICNCDIVTSKKPYYQGTLLRLPLRTRPSEVSENIYTRDKMQNLLKTIEKVAANMFIFTKNINRLEVLRIPNLADPAPGCNLSFVVTCNREEYLLVRGLIQSLHEFNNENRFQSAPSKTVIKLHIETKKWTAASCSPPIKSTWYVSWFTPTDTTALSTLYSEYDTIPLGAVAVPLNEDGSIMNISDLPEGLSNNSQVFCVHPLPIMHSLQFHINGPFKITGERSFLQGYAKDDSGNSFDKWNVHLLQDPVTEALVFLIEVLNSYRRKKYNFFSLWPLQENDTISKIVAVSFYRKIIRSKNNFFKGQETLSDFSQCLFLDHKLQERYPNIAELAVKVILKFEDRRTFVDLPPKYYSQMLSVEDEMMSKVTINASNFLLRYFLPKVEALLGFLDSETITSILVFAVQQEDQEVDSWLKDNDSIPTKPKGKMVCPKQIIHPSSKLACLFSEEEERFPKEEFKSLDKQLERLGMRMNDLDNNDVVERAKTISLLNKNCSECARERQDKFVEYLKSHIDVNKDAIQEVQQIECIPVLQKPRDWSFHWKFASEPPPHRERMTTRNCPHLMNTLMYFHRPVDLYAKHMTNLVGCFGFVAASSYGNLESELKLQVQISTENIVKQLNILTETCNPSSDISKTTEIVNEIYRELDKRCTNLNDKDIIEKSLKDKRVVFASNTFVKPENIALNCTSLGTINCAPYLYRVEDSPLCHFPALCLCLHIQERFSSDVVERAICAIYRSHGNRPLDDDLFAKTVALLEYLSDCVQKTKRCDTLNVYVPDKQKILREVHELVFDDKFESCTSGETYFIFAHGRITAAMANSFGIISRLNKHLRAQCIGNSTQGEPLVKMINDILHVHPSDVDIFKELIRNADDAGATEIHFVNDKTRHSLGSSLDWAQELQGPALFIYHDKGLSADAWEGITHLGRVSESENLLANEQHSMWFNALFNLTDVPSVMTTVDKNERLCILDPLTKHVPSIFNGTQGIVYNNLKLLRNVDPDIVKAYHEDQLRKGCKGTVFRFPLRQKESVLSHTKITSEMITKLFQQFQEEIPQMLIFMKNLVKVSMSEQSETDFKKICCVETHFSGNASSKRRKFIDKYKIFRENVQSGKRPMLSSEQIMENYRFNVLKDSQHLMSVQVVLAFGFKEPLTISNIITDTINGNRICLFPVGGVAVCTKGRDNSDLCHLQKSRAFCLLPLPEETGLSVHINGHFALDTTGRGLWKSAQEGEDECVEFQWNMAIINQVIVPTFVRLIQLWRQQYFSKLSDNKACIYRYECLLPCAKNVKEKYWESLTKSLYKELVKTNDPFAPYVANTRSNTQTRDQLNWIPLKTKDDNDMSLKAFYQPLNSDSRDIAPIFSLIGMQLFNFSEAIATTLQWAGFDVKAVNPATVIDFLKSYTSSDEGSCNIKVDCRIEDSTLHSSENLKKITLFCSGDNDYMAANIQNLPIVMTQDKRLVKVDETKQLYVTKYFEELFRNFGELHSRFIHHSLYDAYISISYKTDYIKVLDIQDFVIICKENEIFDTQSAVVRRWNRDTATAEWIKHVFNFVMDSTQNKNKDSVLRSILLLQELSVVPVEKNNVKFLYPASYVPYILSSELNGNDSLKRVLSKCNIPTIDKSVFLTTDDDRSGNANSTYQLLCLAIPDFSRPKDMLHCLNKNIELIRTAPLDVTDSKAILTYATDNIQELSSETDGEMRDILKALPIFLKVDGTLTHIDGRKVIVSLKDDCLPFHDLEYLQDTLFLQCDHSERALYDYLGSSPKPIAKIYVDDIFQNHMSMTREGFYYHVKFVLKHYKDWEQGNKIRVCLESLAFIGKNNQFRTVGQIFDPKRKIFEEFCSEDELLPKDLQDEALTNEYLTLGFRDKMTIELLIRFAKQLGNDGHLMSCEERDDKSKHLCDELRDLLSMEIGVKDLKCLGTIKFLIADSVEEEFLSVCAGIHEGELTSFSESVLYSKRALCWTTCSLLPKYVDTLLQGIQNHECIQDNLCIKCKPTVPELIKHCKNIGECHRMKNVIFPKGLWDSIYSEFKEYIKDSCNQFPDQKELENIPLVFFPDKNLLLPAANVVIDCNEKEEIMPYLIRAPTHFKTFHDVFLKLGASSNIYASNYARVLTELARDVQSPMLPEEKELSIKATKGLIFSLKSDSEKITFDSMFLPSDKNTMEPATRIVVCDNLSLMERLGDRLPTNLKYLTKWEELSEKPEIIVERMKLLSGDSAPRMLSSLVKEKVMTDNIQQQNDERAPEIMNFLRSHEFIEGILRIINHNFKGIEKEWDEYTIKIETTLLNIKLRHVRGLKSELQIGNDDNEEYIGIVGTEEDVHAYVVPEGNLTVILFQDSNKYWYSHLKDTLAKHLADSLHKVVTFDPANFPLLYTMLDQEYLRNPQAITAFLDKHKRKMYTLSPDARLKYSPSPGMDVPRDYFQYLSNDYGDINEEDFQMVAYEKAEDNMGTNNEENTFETYLFARICKKESQSIHCLFQRYEVDIGEAMPISAPGHRIYTFRREDTAAVSSGSETNSDQQLLPFTQKYPATDIRLILKTAWGIQEEEERIFVVKRLLLKWHPDKNLGNEEYCSKVFRYIQQCILRLEKGQSLENDTEDDWSNQHEHRQVSKAACKFTKGFKRSNYGSFSKNWQHYQHGRNSLSNRTIFCTEKEYEPCPNFAEARDWIRQALEDIKKAKDYPNELGYNLVCYLSHQAAEKALTAAWYAKDANEAYEKQYNHNLMSLASGLDPNLSKLCMDLELISAVTNRRVGECFTKEDAENAVSYAENLLTEVKRIFNLYE